MKDHDQIRRFLFEPNSIRGKSVSLDPSWQKIVSQSNIQGIALTLLGHALTAVTCEICYARYAFDRLGIGQLFLSRRFSTVGVTRH